MSLRFPTSVCVTIEPMIPASDKPRVIIYSRPGCHLCDEAKQVMLSANCDGEYSLTEVNIESDSELRRRYQYDIPVITINGVEAFRHRLTAAEFRSAIGVDPV